MPTLWWSWSEFTLPVAAEDIGEVYSGIAEGLTNAGYTDVRVAEDVHGVKGDFIDAVIYLFIGNRNFWQVIASGGDGSVADAQAEVAEVQSIINQITYL